MRNPAWYVEEVHTESKWGTNIGYKTIIYYWFDKETPNAEYWNKQ